MLGCDELGVECGLVAYRRTDMKTEQNFEGGKIIILDSSSSNSAAI